MAAPLQRMWLSLDEYMRDIKETEASSEAKHKARGYAECMVHILPQPAWPDANTIIRHSVKRYDAYKANQLMPPTPGFLPGKDPDLDSAYGAAFLKLEQEIADAESRPKKDPGPKKAKFDDNLAAAIRKALDNGFEADMLAATYSCSVAEIESLRASA